MVLKFLLQDCAVLPVYPFFLRNLDGLSDTNV